MKKIKQGRNVYFDKTADEAGRFAWKVQFMVLGKNKAFGYFPTKKEAMIHAAAIRAVIEPNNPGNPAFRLGLPILLKAVDWSKIDKMDYASAKEAERQLLALAEIAERQNELVEKKQ